IVKAVELNYSVNPNRCEALVTASSTATAGTYTVTIYAYNEVGEETSAPLTVKITTEETKYKYPVIDEAQSVSVIAGGTAKAVFTGQHIRAWKHGNLPDAVKAVELNYSKNSNVCNVLVTAGSTATAGTYTVTMYAYNEVGCETSADLTVTVTTEKTAAAAVISTIDSKVSVVAGGTAKVKLTGTNVFAWIYWNLPDAIKAVELDYSSDPNICEVFVTAGSSAEAGTVSFDVYAYNEVGEVAETPATITVTIVASEPTDTKPKLTTAPTSVDLVPGGKTTLTFMGDNISFWKYEGSSYLLAEVDLNYSTNVNVCNVKLTANDFAVEGFSDDIRIVAYNAKGESVSSDLVINIVKDDTIPTVNVPAMRDQFKSVVPGGTVKSVISGDADITTWSYEKGTSKVVEKVELDNTTTPSLNICNVIITVSSTAAASSVNTSAANEWIGIYATNSKGNSNKYPIPIFIDVVAPSADLKPTISAGQSVRVAPGESASATFTGTKVVDWKVPTLTELATTDFTSITQNYDRDGSPNSNTVTISAASNATSGEHTITVYAYGEDGQTASADLKVTVSSSSSGSGGVVGSSGGGCDMDFAGLSVLALALTFMKTKHSK
ncbi:MAG: hypothetical protein SPK66_01265, partial [Synergistales bacterium]|nr:hypothetical protein [Synergistales bacterium]